MIRACIYINRRPVHTGTFQSWWDAYASALTRAQLCNAHRIQVKPA